MGINLNELIMETAYINGAEIGMHPSLNVFISDEYLTDAICEIKNGAHGNFFEWELSRFKDATHCALYDLAAETFNKITLRQLEKPRLSLIDHEKSYKSVASLCLELCNHANEYGYAFTAFIEDIDAFIPISWQQRLMHALLHAFKDVQFIVSTNSPIIAAQADKLISIDSDGSVKSHSPNVRFWRWDMIMTEVFGLPYNGTEARREKLKELTKFNARLTWLKKEGRLSELTDEEIETYKSDCALLQWILNSNL